MTDLEAPIVTSVPEALHYQRGLHTLAVKTMEMNIRIPEVNGQPDWSVVQLGWWTVQDLIKEYESRGEYPVDMVMEVRLTGGSDVYLAPMYGNEHGTVSIEVASSPLVPVDVWERFKGDLAATWRSNFEGLKVRPHWAKEFPLEVGDVSTADYIREVYADQLPLFFNTLYEIVTTLTGSMAETQERFSTKYFDEIFPDYWQI